MKREVTVTDKARAMALRLALLPARISDGQRRTILARLHLFDGSQADG